MKSDPQKIFSNFSKLFSFENNFSDETTSHKNVTLKIFSFVTGCCPEDLPRAMNDREEWRERVRDIRATSAI